MSSRSLACFAVIGLMLPAVNARADGPPVAAPPGYAPPGAYPPPPGYLPYPPQGWSAHEEPPYTPMKRRSSGMIAGGIILISLSTVGLIAGTAMFVAGNQQPNFQPCPSFGCPDFNSPDNSALKPAGITSIVVGIASLGAGIPLLAVGSKKVPDRDEAWSPVPALRLGAGTVSASWRF